MISRTFIGHHGTELSLAKVIEADIAAFLRDESESDWLGTGVYFWLENLPRAIDWTKNKGKKIRNRAVIEAVIEAKNVFDVNFEPHHKLLRESYRRIQGETKRNGYLELRNELDDEGRLINRKLDCAVINGVNKHMKRLGEATFDVFIGVFEDGRPIFKGSALRDKSHTQLCVFERSCIKSSKIVWEG